MRYFNTRSVLFFLGMLLASCADKKEPETLRVADSRDYVVEIPDLTVDKSLLRYNNATSQWTLNERPYSGYAVSFYPNGMRKEKMGIWNGRKQNEAIRWYSDGHLQQVANYHRGKLHGEKKRWSADASHTLLAYLNYRSGKVHGEQRQWYPTGELYKKLNLDMGKEAGIQQAFRKNGDLYANYEAKNGRVFGLRKAALCYGLEDENVNYEN